MAKLVFPPEIESATEHPSFIQFDIYERGTTTKSAMRDQIVLFMPDEYSTPNTTSWQDDSFKSMLGPINGISNLLKYASSPAAQAVSYIDGVTANPFIIMMFKGVDLRNFSFTFVLSPRSIAESHIVNSLVKTLRGAAVPAGSGANVNAVYGYPSEVEITHMFNDKPNDFLPKFSRSIITSINVDHMNTGSYSVFRTGAPVSTKIVIEFKELKVILRDDIMLKGY